MNEPVSLDPYVGGTLMRDLVGHDHKPAAYLLYLALCAIGRGGRVTMSHRQLAEWTGLSKRSVQDAARHLEGRGLLRIERRGRTEAASLTPLSPWRREKAFSG